MSAHELSRVRPAHYPVMLDLAGQDALLIGGGGVAARKATALLSAGVRLRVVAPSLGPALRARHEAGELRWEARAAQPGDAAGNAIVVCAASDREANAMVAAEARAAGIPVAVADAPEAGTVVVPASLRRGRLVVAVSSSAGSPALAAFVRRQLEETLGPEFEQLADLAARMRQSARHRGLDAATRERLAAAALPRLLELLRAGRTAEAEALAEGVGSGRAEVDTAEAAPWS